MSRIAVVKFGSTDEPNFAKPSNTKEYEYLLPESATGEEKFGVVTTSTKPSSSDQLKIVRITQVKSVVDGEYDGDLKPMVAAFSVDEYVDWTNRLALKKSLLQKIEKKLSERSKIAQLEALAGGDEDAKALLDAYKSLK